MAITDWIFYGFAFIGLFSGAMVIFSKNPIRAVLWMILCFFATAPIWLWFGSEFLAILLVLVYVGAVMVLFLFLLMMLHIKFSTQKARFTRLMPFGLALFLAGLYGFWEIIRTFSKHLPKVTEPVLQDRLFALAKALFTHYLYPFELAGIILLVAIICAITLWEKKELE